MSKTQVKTRKEGRAEEISIEARKRRIALLERIIELREDQIKKIKAKIKALN